MLSAAQLTTLKADIAANANQINGVAINTLANNEDNNFAIAAWYSQLTTTPFWGNYATVPINDVKNAVSFKAYTPTDAVPASGSTTQITNDILNHLARTMLCQSFQINVNNLLTAGTTIDATKASIVQAWKDCTNSDMPSGASGVAAKGGWTGIQKILCRLGKNIEKLFADTSGGTGADNTHAATFVFEGTVSINDVDAARALP